MAVFFGVSVVVGTAGHGPGLQDNFTLILKLSEPGMPLYIICIADPFVLRLPTGIYKISIIPRLKPSFFERCFCSTHP